MGSKFEGLICVKSIEYSLFSDSSIQQYCPSCGHSLNVRSELFADRIINLILFGTGAYLCYRIIHWNNTKMMRKRLTNKFWHIFGWNDSNPNSVHFSNDSLSPAVAFMKNQDNDTFRTIKSRDNSLSDSLVPDLDLPHPSTSSSLSCMDDYHLHLPSSSWGFPTMDVNDHRYVHDNGFSSGNVTVDKIDKVLTQMDDLKKSIVEIDAQLFKISGSKVANFNPAFFTLTNGELDTDDGTNEVPIELPHELPKTPFQEQSLEWDLTDFNDGHYFFDDDDGHGHGNNIHIKDQCVDSLQDISSLPVTDADKQRLKSMGELLEEAQQLGLLNNLLEALSKVKNRDSAFHDN